MTIIEPIRTLWKRWRVKHRRRKLTAAYAKVGRVRHDLGPGISPTMYAYDRILNEDLAVIVENDGEAELVWLWPEDDRSLQPGTGQEADA